MREGGREGGSEGGREVGREGGREGGKKKKNEETLFNNITLVRHIHTISI